MTETGGHEGLAIAAVANFVLLAGMIVYFARKPLAQSFFSKHETVKGAVAEAESLRKSVEQMMTDYKRKLENLDQEIETILREAKAEGEQEKARILARAERLAEKIRQDAILGAEKEKERIKGLLEKETLSEASRRAVELLKGRVTEKDHRAFTNELIERLENETNG